MTDTLEALKLRADMLDQAEQERELEHAKRLQAVLAALEQEGGAE